MDDEHDRHLTVCFINLVDHPLITDAIAEIAFQWSFKLLDIPVLVWIFPKVLKAAVQTAN